MGEWAGERDTIIERLDALDILVSRLVHLVGQMQPGVWEFLSAPPDRQVPDHLKAYNDRVSHLVLQIVERERALLDRGRKPGPPPGAARSS